MTRKIRSETELREASEHLYYEIGMFRTLVELMASGTARDTAINNALLESFGIHIRTLLGFFYAEKAREDDVIAEDYFPLPTDWYNRRPQMTERLRIAKARAHKEIAHLTYKRLEISIDSKMWKFIPIYNDMNKVIITFVSSVNGALLCEMMNSTYERWITNKDSL